MDNRLKRLKEEVFKANISLVENKLVTGTFGNVSGIDRNEVLDPERPAERKRGYIGVFPVQRFNFVVKSAELSVFVAASFYFAFIAHPLQNDGNILLFVPCRQL